MLNVCLLLCGFLFQWATLLLLLICLTICLYLTWQSLAQTFAARLVNFAAG